MMLPIWPSLAEGHNPGDIHGPTELMSPAQKEVQQERAPGSGLRAPGPGPPLQHLGVLSNLSRLLQWALFRENRQQLFPPSAGC